MTLENHYNTISYLALVGSSTAVFDSEEPAEERFFFDKFLLVLLIKNASSDWDRVELAHPKITIRWQGGTKQRGTTKGALTKEAPTKGAPRPKGHCQRGTAKGAPD